MENTNTQKNFTMIPNDNAEFYAKGFNILHAYIVERVRSFEAKGRTCYISNEQLAASTGTSVSTIKRAIKLLVDEKVLWAGYHQQDINNKQRVLRIYNEKIAKQEEKKEEVQNEPLPKEEPPSTENEFQIEPERGSNCTPERFKMNPLEVQNEPLVYKEKIKKYNYNIDKEKVSGQDRAVSSINIHIDKAKEQATNWCIAHNKEHLIDNMVAAITKNVDGAFGMYITKDKFIKVCNEILQNDELYLDL